MSTVSRLVEPLGPLATAGRDVVVDFSGIDFFGTAGLTALADLQRRATAAGGSMRLSQLPAPVWRLLAITGMADRFDIVADGLDAPTPLRVSAAAAPTMPHPRKH